jgi:hypothetical protein
VPAHRLSTQAWLQVHAAEQSIACRRGHAVKATRGDAVFFWALKPDGGKDRSSLHGSCPTLKVHQPSVMSVTPAFAVHLLTSGTDGP